MGHEGGQIRVFDMGHAAKPLASLKVHEDAVLSLDVNAAGTEMLSGGPDAYAKWTAMECDKARLRVAHTSVVPRPGVSCVSFRGDERVVATGGWDRRVRVFTTEKRGGRLPIATLWGAATGSLTGVEWSLDGKMLFATMDGGGGAMAWEIFPPKLVTLRDLESWTT